jgi:hypothetical protein
MYIIRQCTANLMEANPKLSPVHGNYVFRETGIYVALPKGFISKRLILH